VAAEFRNSSPDLKEGVVMPFEQYLAGLRAILERLQQEQAENIRQAGRLVADALSAGGLIHTFGTGHSHLIAEEVFFRAGGIAAVNPILDERLMFLKGALESTRAERESGFAGVLLAQVTIRAADAAIIISNSGRNAAPVEMAMEMKARGVSVVAITNLQQSHAARSRHNSGKRLFESADVVIDNCVPAGDALLSLPGLPGANDRVGASSTVAGAAIVNSIMIEAVSELLRRGESVPVLPSANVDGTTADGLRKILRRYQGRIRYLDLETEF
jgi:uncharacterized phosphosugar-binding protein